MSLFCDTVSHDCLFFHVFPSSWMILTSSSESLSHHHWATVEAPHRELSLASIQLGSSFQAWHCWCHMLIMPFSPSFSLYSSFCQLLSANQPWSLTRNPGLRSNLRPRSSRSVRGHIQRNIHENEKNKSKTKYQINTCGTMIKKGWWTNCSWSFSQNHKHSEKKHYRGSRRGGRNYSKSHGVKWRSSKNPTQKSNYQMIYSFWEFQPLLAPPLVGMCIIQTGFINITDEWSNPVSTPQNCPWPTEQRRWAWTWSGESQITGVGLLTPWEKTEVHWVAPRAVPVSWSGHIWSHMVTFSVTGCMVDDHSSSLLSGGFTHFDLAFIVRLRGRSCHHGTSTNESVATFATTEVWLESSTVVSTKICKILQAMSVGVLAVLSAVASYEVP